MPANSRWDLIRRLRVNLITVPKFWWNLVPPSLRYGDCARRFLQNFSTSLLTYNASHSTRLISHILP